MQTIRSRVILLAGAGVFAAGAILSLASRASLLALNSEVRDAHASVAAASADAVAREVTADMQTLEAIAIAPRVQTPEISFAHLRLATAVCYVPSGLPAHCVPADAAHLLSGGAATAFLKRADGVDGAAVAVFDGRASHLKTLLAPNTALGVASDTAPDIGAAVAGTPWIVRYVTPGGEDPVMTFRRRSLWLAPLLAGLAVLLAGGIGVSVNRPVSALMRAAEQIANGDLSNAIPGGSDELGRLGTALERMRRSLQASRESSALLKRIITAQEDERRRVARELHDDTSQLIAALGLAVGDGPPAALVGRLHDSVHRLIMNLRPATLDDLGLAAAIRGMAETHLARAGIHTRCELADWAEARLDPAIEIALFRIVQEAIFNIVRHSGATTVLIQGGRDARHAWVEVEDDGAGFDQAAMKPDERSLRGIGLLGMRERAELIGGTLQIETARGQGTRVRVDVPL